MVTCLLCLPNWSTTPLLMSIDNTTRVITAERKSIHSMDCGFTFRSSSLRTRFSKARAAGEGTKVFFLGNEQRGSTGLRLLFKIALRICL